MKRRSSQIRATRPHRTPEQKAEILRAHELSGLSLLAFARKQGLCYASLMRWRGRRRKGASVLTPSDTEADPHFVPVKIEAEVVDGDYLLSWGGGRSLKIPRHFETDSLRRLLTVLEGAK